MLTAKQKERKQKTMKKWRRKNAARVRAAGRAWRRNNPEKVRAAKAASYARNPEKDKARHRRWKKKNRARYLAQNKAYYYKNRERILAEGRALTRNNPTRRRSTVLKRFGMTESDYQRVLKTQKYACAICKKPFAGLTSRQIHLDHDHATGRFRAVLCHHCNIMLGGARDSIKTLKAGIRYLRKHSPETSL